MALLDARNFEKSLTFALGRDIVKGKRRHTLYKLVETYLRDKEVQRGLWDRIAIQHRGTLKTLYAKYHVKPAVFAKDILFEYKYRSGSVFDSIHRLRNMPAQEAAMAIMKHKIPFLIAVPALGANAKSTDLVMALINNMSATEIVTNTEMLNRLGVQNDPSLRAAYEKAITNKVSQSTKGTFKTTTAAQAVTDDRLRAKLQGAQEQQMKKLGGPEGDWLVIGDKSGSMAQAIEASRHVAATLAKMVKGEVHLVFVDNMPRYVTATGKDYDTLLKETSRISANGGTCLGAAIRYIHEKGINVDGIAIISDGGENAYPSVATAYQEYVQAFGKQPPIYFYQFKGDPDAMSMYLHNAQIEFQTFDLRNGVDYYSLPNLVKTMNTQRYGLMDQIMDTPLITVKDVLKKGAELCWQAN
jgi:hypothetical protein